MILSTELKPAHGSPEWMAARHRDRQGRARLTASVAGVLFGKHPFISPADLAVQMLRDEPPDDRTTEAMTRGQALEPALLAHWSGQHGVAVERPEVMFINDRWLANLDGIVVGTDEPLEAKTTRHRFHGVLPEYWFWQGVAQRYCLTGTTGLVHWVILDGDLRIQECTVEVNAEDLSVLDQAGEEWLGYIDLGMTPPMVELDADHVQALYPTPSRAEVDLTTEGLHWVGQLASARSLSRSAKRMERDARDWLARHLGDHETGLVDGKPVVTWSAVAGRKSFDKAGFAADHPDLVDKYTIYGRPTRRMCVVGDEEDMPDD